VQLIFVRFVELDSLFDDGLIVIVQADAAILERARTSTRCDFKRVYLPSASSSTHVLMERPSKDGSNSVGHSRPSVKMRRGSVLSCKM
jgi:hypothetical protein